MGIVPDELDYALVSESYVVLRCNNAVDTAYLWFILRSAEIKADLMSVSTGTSRYTTGWESARLMKIPWLTKDVESRCIKRHEIFNSTERNLTLRTGLYDEINDLGIESEESKKRLNSYQPPK